MVHLLLDTNECIDIWLDARLVHDLYLKSMEDHLSMINCEKLIGKLFSFCINIFPQATTLARVVDCFHV
jgi:hypothetical protein